MKLALKVIPNAKKSEAVGWEEDPRAGRALKLRIAAPPVEGHDKDTHLLIQRIIFN